jgi:hypothetical protein
MRYGHLHQRCRRRLAQRLCNARHLRKELFMIEITRQLSGIALKVETLSDASDLVGWALTQPGIVVIIAARVDNTLLIQCEGEEIPTVYPQLGNWVVFDGAKFSVYEDDSAFVAAGYEIPE